MFGHIISAIIAVKISKALGELAKNLSSAKFLAGDSKSQIAKQQGVQMAASGAARPHPFSMGTAANPSWSGNQTSKFTGQERLGWWGMLAKRKDEGNISGNKTEEDDHKKDREAPSAKHARQQVIGKIPQLANLGKTLFDGLKSTFSKAGAAEGAAGAAGGVAGDVAATGLKLAAGGMAGVAGAAAGLIAVFVAIEFAGLKLAEAQVESQRYLVAFNGQIAAAYAKLEQGDLMRNLRTGAGTAASTESLVSAVNDMRDAWQPAGDAMTNLKNNIAVPFVKIATGIGIGVAKLIELYDFITMQGPAVQVRGPWEDLIVRRSAEFRKNFRPQPQVPPGPNP